MGVKKRRGGKIAYVRNDGTSKSDSAGGANFSDVDQSAYNDELNNANYRYSSYYEALNSTNDTQLKKEILVNEMRMNENVFGENPITSMKNELESIKRAISENNGSSDMYGFPKSVENGIGAALKEHERRIVEIINMMETVQDVYNRNKSELRRKKGMNWM